MMAFTRTAAQTVAAVGIVHCGYVLNNWYIAANTPCVVPVVGEFGSLGIQNTSAIPAKVLSVKYKHWTTDENGESVQRELHPIEVITMTDAPECLVPLRHTNFVIRPNREHWVIRCTHHPTWFSGKTQNLAGVLFHTVDVEVEYETPAGPKKTCDVVMVPDLPFRQDIQPPPDDI